MTWAQFLPHISDSIKGFLKGAIRDCARNIMAHIRVLAPTLLLERLTEVAENQQYIDVVTQAESQVEALGQKYVDGLEIDFPADGGDE